MKIKKLVNLFLAVVFILSFSTAVSASVTISPFYLYTNTVDNNLVIISKTATCESTITGLSTVTKIESTQYLQKWNGSKWVDVSGASWSSSKNNTRLSMTNDKSGLSSGTYRVYVEATVYSGSKSEVVTGSSNSVTI